MANRRPGDPARGNRGSGRPGDRRPGRSGSGAGRGSGGVAPRAAAAATEPTRSRFTGRAAVLLLVLLVLMMSYASSMKAYLRQRAHIDSLNAQIAEQEQRIEALQREKQRWEDPAYVRMQARARFGYVLPGETSFVVVDANGDPVDAEATLGDPAGVAEEPTAWWDSAWASVELAGNPPRAQTAPVDTIRERTG